MTKLLIVPGSLRAASSSRAFANALAEALKAEAEIEFADIGALPHYNDDLGVPPVVQAWKDQVAAADAVLFVTPEYNYSIPGPLKNAIDWASRPGFEGPFKGKPYQVYTVSGGATAGVRAQGHMKSTMSGLLAELVPTKEVAVPFANQKVEDGVFKDDAVMEFALAAARALLARAA